MKESKELAFFSVTAVSTTLICINIFTLYLIGNYFGLFPIIKNKPVIIIFMLSLGFINHYSFVRNKKFLVYKFQKDKRGGFFIISYLLFTAILIIIIGNYNREKIFENNFNNPKVEKKESLEGKIRKWFEEQ